MALAPKFAGQAVAGTGFPAAVHTIELCLDYACPFSGKMWKTLSSGVFTNIDKKYSGKVRFIFRQQIQPWHPSSTLMHEAGAAVLKVDPKKFTEFSTALFDHQKEYFDVNVVNETRNQTYERLAKLAGSIGLQESKIMDLLRISDKPGKDGALNTGNEVTDDIKVMTKANRLQSLHVTPTVLFNGVVENGISSSFTPEQWDEWLEKNIV